MPGKRTSINPPEANRLCKRDCFTRYVHTKVAKRMETFRVRYSGIGQQRKLLLPISFGVSSVTLLHVLNHHLGLQQEKTGRTGFDLHVVHVDTSDVEDNTAGAALMHVVQKRYPRHTYSSILLSDVYDSEEALSVLNMLEPETNKAIEKHTALHDRLSALLASLPSATSRADMVQILRTRLAVRFAKLHGCEAILWGDSTTRLAERTLAETAKGRGFALPWNTADGESPHGLAFYYPMRDLLKKELIAHADLAQPPLAPLLWEENRKVAVSTKNVTIDELMARYFETVEKDYPSIVANVVKTTGKLKAPVTSADDTACGLCHMPLIEPRFQVEQRCDGQSKDSMQVEAPRALELSLCYGCARTMPEDTGLLP
ncbi:Cytoplasmic tRNA 2-thiolation protein 2 [Elasticomyces elasticus]|nr:Cytoplasmic tRNA 2-thiolation protein 2 [Elasticomyces elasticus]